MLETSAGPPSPPGGTTAPVGMVRLLEEDPDLGGDIAPDARRLATRCAVAPLFEFPPGPWRFCPPAEGGSLGLLILDGLIVVRLDTGERAHIELVGAGDVIAPWVGLGPDACLRSAVTARVLTPVRLAHLDRRFTSRAVQWPEIPAAIGERLVIRTRRLCLQSAINSLARTDERLELTFWTLAYRFGRVTADGYSLRLRLSHSRLAEMVAATRPSVSAAISRLKRTERLLRTDNEHEWLLIGPPPASLARLTARARLPT